MNNFYNADNMLKKIYSVLVIFFISLTIAIAQPNATSLPCGVSSAQSLTANGYSGSNPTTATGSCGQCCYAGSDLDGDGDQDVSFSVENSKWYKYCNPSNTTAITIDFIIDETNNDCNLQGAVFVGGTNPNGATDALDIDCSNQEFAEYGSNVSGNADGFSFTGVTIPPGGCAYLMVDGYGGATCGAFTINTVCPPACTVPTTMTAGSDISICEGTSGALNSTVSGGLTSGAGLVYSWSPSTGLSCTTCADPTANPTSTTTYTLTACNGGTGFCCVTDQVVVNVTPSFVANAGADITSCAPSTVTIGGSGSSPTGPAGSTYTWVVSGTNNSGIAITAGANTSNPTVTISAGATGSETYSVTVVNGACTRTDLVTVTVGTLLVSAGADQTVCAGSTVSIGGAPTAPAGATYTWTCSGTACANLTLSSTTAANPVVTANSSATGTATYTVSANLSGCTNTDVVIVTVNSLPTTPSATASASPVCAGQSVILTASGGAGSGTYSWWTAATNGTNLGSGNTLTVTPTVTTTYYIQSTDATTGCISLRGSVTVTVNPTPVANAGSDVTLCVGQDYTLLGSILNAGACSPAQTWSLISGTGTFSPNVNALNAVFTPTSSGTIQIRLTPCTPGGCTPVSDDIILTVAASPSVTVSSTSNTICQGLINDLNGVVTGGTVFPPTITSQTFTSGTGPFPFLDNDPNGVVIPVPVSGVSNSTLGTTTISSLTVNVDHNRIGQVEVYLCPPGVSATSPYTGCLLMFNNSGGNGDDLVNTIFTDASATDIAAGTPPYTGSFNLDGTNTLSSLSGSPTNGTWNLVVLDNNGSNPATTGSAGQWEITFQTPIPNPPYTYTWTPSTGLSVTNDVSTSLFTSGFTAPTSVTHTLTVSDANGCTSSGSVTTNIISPPTSTAGSNQTVCGTSVSLTGNALTAGYTGVWSVVSGSGTFSAGTSNTTNVTGLSAGANVFEWTVTNSCGSASSQVTITANPIPAVTNTITTTTSCGTANALLTPVSGVSGATFAWTAANTVGTITGFTASGSGNINETLTNGSSTTAGTVVYTITPSANGCAGTAVTYSVVVNPSPTLSGIASACVGATSQLSGNGTANSTTPWISTNGTVATVNSTGLINALAAGNTTITYMNASGCSTSTTFTVHSNPTVSGTLSACVGSTSQLAGSVTANAITPWASSNTNATVSNTGMVSAASAGTSIITYMNTNGCTVTATFTVNANPIIIVSGTNAICSGSGTSLSATGGSTYNWSPSGSLNISSGASVTATPTVSTVYTINGTDVNSCVGSTTYSVTVNDNPTAINFTAVDASCGGNDGTVTITGTVGGTATYQYNFNNLGLSSTTIYNNLGANSYPLIVRDQNGCTFSTFVNINNSGGPSSVASTLIADSCGRSTGEILIGAVTGGGGTYSYSVDGSVFSGITNYAGLASGGHSIEVMDQNNCSFSTTVVIPALVGPTGFSTNNIDETCGSLNGSIDVVSVNGGTAAYTYSINGGVFVGTTTFGGLATGTYTITVKDANTCELVNQVSITNIEGPTAIDSSILAATCGASNGSITLGTVTGGVGADEFNINGGAYSSANSFNGLAAGIYTISVRDDNSCVYTTQISVGNSGGPSSVNTTIVDATCGLSNGSISVDGVSGGTGSYQYSLDGVTYSSTNVFSNLSASNYTIYVQDGNLCGYNEPFVIAQADGPISISNTIVDATCGASNGSLDITNVIGGTAPFQYDFNNGGMSGNTNFVGLIAGTYPLIVEDANACTYTTSIIVAGSPEITGVISNVTNEACGQLNGTINVAFITGGTGPYQYSVNNGPFGSANSFSNLSAGTYTITIQDDIGCTYDEPISIGLTAGPSSITSSVIDAGCTIANGSITINSVVGGTPSYSYGIDGGVLSSNNTFGSLAAGTYIITIQDANICTYTTTVNVNTLNGPTAADITPSSSTCGNSNGVITIGTITGGASPYEYSLNGGTLTTNNVFSGLSASSYTIGVLDAAGCLLTINPVIVTDLAGPSSAITSQTDATCGNSNGSITVDIVNGGTSPYTYNIDGGVYVSTNNFTSLNSGQSYTISIVDANNCLLTLAPITLNATGGPLSASTTQVNTSCGNSNGSITVDPLSVVGGTSPYTYSINGGTAVSSNVFTGLSSSGSHTITIIDANGCSVILPDVTLTNVAGPTAIDSSVVEVSCGATNGGFTVNSVVGGEAPYTYDLNNQGFGAATSISNLGVGSYPVSIQDANGCVYNTNVVVAGSGALDASFTASPTSGILPLTTVFDNNSTTGVNYEWTFGNGASATTYDAQQQYITSGVYTVILVVSNGVDLACNDTASVIITVMGEPTVTVPNIFSPNGDGINDVLSIQSSGYKELDIAIFNRWGTLIASFNAIGGSWSGDNNSEGTYFYILKGKRVDDQDFESHGAIMLVK